MDNLEWPLPQEVQSAQPENFAKPPCVVMSTIAASPVTSRIKRDVQREREKSSNIFTVLSVFLVAIMVLQGIYTMPNGALSQWSFSVTCMAIAVTVLWSGIIGLIEKGKKKTEFFDFYRVNEVDTQKAVSVCSKGKTVIPFKDVTAFVETDSWMALFSNQAEIVWSASDLTAAESQRLLTVLATYLPGTVFLRKSPLRPIKPYETPLPYTFEVEPAAETMSALRSVSYAVSKETGVMLKKSMTLFLLASVIMANVLCDSFGMFSYSPLLGRLFFIALTIAVCAEVAALLVMWEQTGRVRACNRNGVWVRLTENTIRVEESDGYVVIPKNEWHPHIDGKRTLHFLAGGNEVTVAYTEYAKTSLGRLFNS